jgi:hypothetical protein
MGLEINSANFLLGEMQRNISFSKTLTLGRQELHIENNKYRSFFKEKQLPSGDIKYADDFFNLLGADFLDIMDASSYEGATVIHNLNNPLPDHLKCSYDCVIDGGTLEHIFNFPVALKNCMEMVKMGGRLILMTPWHNWAGHGFYEFSPELFYNALSLSNGYSVERMLVVHNGQWYNVMNPADIGSRVEIKSLHPILLFISAKRVDEKEIFSEWPQQSDYSVAWNKGVYGSIRSTKRQGFMGATVNFAPGIMKPIQNLWRKFNHYRQLSHPFSDSTSFTPVKSANGIPLFETQ